mmetsp:Transcript_12840/g.35182  ORF Transcript_12840/g.35182 Transcript_12840/m.35182 type:complete len:203 (-) Transcript_12840:609-1217(-)
MGPRDSVGLPVLGGHRPGSQVGQYRVCGVVASRLLPVLHPGLRLGPGRGEHPDGADGPRLRHEVRPPHVRAAGAVDDRGSLRLEAQLSLAVHEGGPATDLAAHGRGPRRPRRRRGGPHPEHFRGALLPRAHALLAEVPRPHGQGLRARPHGRADRGARPGALQHEVPDAPALGAEGARGRLRRLHQRGGPRPRAPPERDLCR